MSYGYGLYCRLRVDVLSTNMDVIRAVRRRFKRGVRTRRRYRAERHKVYREMLRYHKNARKLYFTLPL